METRLFREYTVREKLALWRGKFAGDKRLWDTIITTDLTREVQKLDVPVLPREVRLHGFAAARESIPRSTAGAREGVLHLRALGSQPDVRGT